MLKELIENKCVDISRLLLLRAKELNIDDNECHILLIVYTLKDIGIKTVTPQMIQNYSVLSNQELDKVLASLLNKKLICNRLGSISLNELEKKLLCENKEIEEKASEVAKLYGANDEKMVELLLQNQREALVADVMTSKVINFLKENN